MSCFTHVSVFPVHTRGGPSGGGADLASRLHGVWLLVFTVVLPRVPG